MQSESERWAIVGGGFLGMTLAHRLAQQGKQVTLFEGADHLGGLAGAWRLGDVVWDRHYHVTLLSDRFLRSVLEELGLESEMKWVETRTGFYTDGQLHSMSNTMEFLRFPPLNLLGKLRLGATIFYASKITNWKRLEKIPVDLWLRRLSGKRTFERIWLPLLRAKLGENYRKASAAFIWATIARMYAARRTGLKKEMFGYVPGGSRVESVGNEVGVEFRNGHRETFDQVVLTMAAPIAVRICDGLTERERELLNGIQYQGVICASFLLKQPLAGYYVTNITDGWVPFTAVIEMSALVDRDQFGGNTLVYLPKYVAPDDPTFALSDEALQKMFFDALLQMYPHLQPSDLLSFRVSREKYVLGLSTLNYSERLPAMTTSVPGVHIVNSAHIVNGTLNVNETIQLAERAARRIGAMPARVSAPIYA
jgi:protoporphyrinogen oxidase